MVKPEYYDDSVKEIGEGFVIIEKKLILEKGKTTTKGEHPKLNSNDRCKFPERASCNYGEFFIRCPFMKYNNSYNCWSCTYGKTD